MPHIYRLNLLNQDWQSNVIGRSVCHCVVLSVSKITHDRSKGRRPNMVDMGKW